MNNNTVGSTGTETAGFQLLKGATVTFTNGTLNNSTTKGAKIMLQNYSYLTLDNFTVDVSMSADGYGLYAVSNNFGSLTVKNGSNIYAKEGEVAFDLWYGMYDVYADGVHIVIEEDAGVISGPIEYGASSRITETGWEEKTLLEIKGGTFQNFSVSITTDVITTANIVITGGLFDATPEAYVNITNYEVVEENGAFGVVSLIEK